MQPEPEENRDGCVHCFTLWTCGAEWGASGVSTVFSLVDETRRQGHAGWGGDAGGTGGCGRAREQSGLHTDVEALVGSSKHHPGLRIK